MTREKIAILTGAGISAESGLKTFRDSNGLWENYRIEDVATPEGWERNPQLVLDFYNQRRRDVRHAQPNAAHRACAQLEERYETVVITQNIDDLHERGGSHHIIHLHGEILKAQSSADAGLVVPMLDDLKLGDLAPDGTQLRPHVVWFGEAVPRMDEAVGEVNSADLLLVVGTSLQVYPAAALLQYTRPGAALIAVDPHPVELTHSHFRAVPGKAAEKLPGVVENLIRNGLF